jgi:hypothetical protein
MPDQAPSPAPSSTEHPAEARRALHALVDPLVKA